MDAMELLHDRTARSRDRMKMEIPGKMKLGRSVSTIKRPDRAFCLSDGKVVGIQVVQLDPGQNNRHVLDLITIDIDLHLLGIVIKTG